LAAVQQQRIRFLEQNGPSGLLKFGGEDLNPLLRLQLLHLSVSQTHFEGTAGAAKGYSHALSWRA